MIHVFIINTNVVEADFSENLRKKLSERGDIRYFAYNTSRPGMEREVTKKMIQFFEGERLRFYCCGGSGTMRNIMLGAEDYKNVEFAFCPCGQTNDFLKVFGYDAEEFKDIDKLIDGHAEQIDYIKTNYGVALNTVSFGLDTMLSDILEKTQDYDIFGKNLSFFLSYFISIFKTKPRKLNFIVDNCEFTENVTEMIVGNGCVLGGHLYFTDNADYKDGYFDYLMAGDYGPAIMKTLSYMLKEDIEKVRERTKYGKGTHFELITDDGNKIAMNLDGEIVEGGNEWTIDIIKKGMNFVIPKGVSII